MRTTNIQEQIKNVWLNDKLMDTQQNNIETDIIS